MRLNRIKEIISNYEALSKIDREKQPFQFAEAARNFFNEYGLDAYCLLANELALTQSAKDSRKLAKQQVKQREESEAILQKDIWEVGFTSKTGNLLRGININTVGDLLNWSEVDLLRQQNIGRVTLTEVKGFLKKYGFTLGLKLPDSI